MDWSAEIVGQAIASGLLMGFIYALIATGLCLIWGMMELVNFAHGEFMMVGMYTTFWMFILLKVDPIFSIPVAMLAVGLLGVLAYFRIIKPVYKLGYFLPQMFATFGLGMLLRSSAQFFFTPDYRLIQNPLVAGRVALGGIYLGTPQLVASVGAVAGFVALYLFIKRTDFGLRIQATAENKETAALMGIDSDRVFSVVWLLGGASVGLAGALLTNFYYIFPDVGGPFSTMAYVAVAVGGFGSIPGAFLGGILVGLVEVVGGLVLGPGYKYLAIFVLYLLVVFFRPMGLFGKY